jgi:hypothetical protein
MVNEMLKFHILSRTFTMVQGSLSPQPIISLLSTCDDFTPLNQNLKSKVEDSLQPTKLLVLRPRSQTGTGARMTRKTRHPLDIAQGILFKAKPLAGAGSAATLRWQRWLLLTSASVAVLTALSAGSAVAQTWNGTVSTDWTNAANWTGGVPTSGDVTINTSAPNPAVLGVGSAASATSNALNVGTGGGSGRLTIQNGSLLTSTATSLVYVGQDAGSIGLALKVPTTSLAMCLPLPNHSTSDS